jgi:hypothetical protein
LDRDIDRWLVGVFLYTYRTFKNNYNMIHAHPASGFRRVAGTDAEEDICVIFSSAWVGDFGATDVLFSDGDLISNNKP